MLFVEYLFTNVFKNIAAARLGVSLLNYFHKAKQTKDLYQEAKQEAALSSPISPINSISVKSCTAR